METMILLAVAFTAGGLCGVVLGIAIGVAGKDKGDGP